MKTVVLPQLTVSGEPAQCATPAVVPGHGRDVGSLIREHHAFVWRVLRRSGLSESDADDAAQRVFMVFARRFEDVEPGRERAFLARTATRVASRAHRTRQRRREEPAPDWTEVADATPAPDELLEQRRAVALLDEILDELSPDLRAVLVLFDLEGLGTREVADALGIPRGTVASRLRRARAEVTSRTARKLAGTRHRRTA